MEKIMKFIDKNYFACYVSFVVFCAAAMWTINLLVGLTVPGFWWSLAITVFFGWEIYKEYRRRPAGRRARKVVR